MFATLFLAIASPAAAPAAPQGCASPLPAERLAGRWSGPFAGADWVFELSRDGTAWVGRYQTSKAQVWRPLEQVTVTGGCANFSLKSEPRVTFVLALDADGATLAGDIDIAGRATLPFAAKRDN